jgi:azurin
MRNTIPTIIALLVIGCNDKPQSNPMPVPVPVPVPTVASAEPIPSAIPASPKSTLPTAELKVSSIANTMAFDVKSLTVKAGQPVHLVFTNHSTMATLPHNWVLVNRGTEASVAAHGLTMGEPAGYIDVRDKNVLAFTPLAKQGETVEVSFTAPETGTYAFICSVPGHYMVMHGDFLVQ